MSFTFATLKTALQDYTDNTETIFVNNLSNFIKAAEEKIFKSVDLDIFRKNVTSAFTASDPFLTVPADYLASFSLQITTSGSESFLLQKDVNYLREYTPASTTTGLPKYYARFDTDNFIVAPTPNSNYTLELHYYYRPASLTAGADSGTTWISTNAPFALLYGALVEAYTFMKGEPDVVQNYNNLYLQYMERLKDLGEARENTDGYRVGLPSRPRTQEYKMATANAATTFLENRLLSFIFKNNAASFSSPGDGIYVGLATAVSNFNDSTGETDEPTITEATFGAYARQQVTAANWTLTSDTTEAQTIKNAANIEFPASTGTSNTITHVFVATHATASLDTEGSGGNVLFIGALDASKTIATGDIFRINANNLTIELK